MKRWMMTWICLSILTSWTAHAQIFTCKDSSGRTITSDRVIPECANRPMRELTQNGIMKREIPAPLTPEQRRQADVQEEKRKAEAAAAEEERQRDRAILIRYRNEGDIEIARKQALDRIKELIRRENTLLAIAEKQWQDAQAKAESYNLQKAPIPFDLKRRLEESGQIIKSEKKIIADYQAEIGQANIRFDETLKRYREINEAPSGKAPGK